ncbi:MAG: DUF6599 family protein [Planctomycetota bacterium]
MDSVPDRAKRLESVVSICLLAILFLIVTGILIKQSHYNMSRFGIDTVTAELSPQKLEVNKEKETPLSALVPAGFETLSRTEIYKPENLYEKINGKAPLYVESGFEKLSTQRFVNGEDENLWMELYVYDMATIRNAFSVYSVQRRAEAELFPPMRFAYKTSNALYFVHGKYYIELVGSSESADLLRAMAEVARKIRANFAIDYDTEITELTLFPQENLHRESIKLYPANAFGFEGLTNTFTAPYKFGDDGLAAFLSRCSGPKQAQLTAESYYNFLINNGGSAKQTGNKILKGKIVDFYGTTEIVFATGPFVGGIHEAEDQQAAEKLAEILLNKLNEAANSLKNNE